MAGEFGGGGFRIGVLGLVAGIANYFRGFYGITAKDILRNIAYLKDQTTALETTHVGIFWKLGGALATALTTFATYVKDHTRAFLKWAGDKLRKLEQYLKTKFGPILHYLKVLKDHINDIYKRFVKPIIDTIEYFRQLNRVLHVFHVHIFDKLDQTLQQIERRIEEPFIWIQAHITELMNLVDRVMTADGLFQRLTLIRSMHNYAPTWIGQFWAKQLRAAPAGGPFPGPADDYPVHDVSQDVSALTDYWSGGEGERAALIEELRLDFTRAMATAP